MLDITNEIVVADREIPRAVLVVPYGDTWRAGTLCSQRLALIDGISVNMKPKYHGM